MEPVHTNIVVVDPDLVDQPVEQPIPESINREEYSCKLAQDAISFLEEEFKNDVTDDFWRIIRDAADARMRNKEKDPEPMSEVESKKFGNEIIPWGKYEGQKVQTVLKKDPSSLDRLSVRPLPFQIRLKRFLSSPFDKTKKITKIKKPKG